MVDQLNKLTKVDYTKHISDVTKGLENMYPEKPSDFLEKKGSNLMLPTPKFFINT